MGNPDLTYLNPPFGDGGGVYFTPRRVANYIFRALRWLRWWGARLN